MERWFGGEEQTESWKKKEKEINLVKAKVKGTPAGGNPFLVWLTVKSLRNRKIGMLGQKEIMSWSVMIKTSPVR